MIGRALEPTHIRGMHWAAFRSGEWAEILTTIEARERPCYLVRFPDGVTDYWLIDNSGAEYEFKREVPA